MSQKNSPAAKAQRRQLREMRKQSFAAACSMMGHRRVVGVTRGTARAHKYLALHGLAHSVALAAMAG